jgi:hypothetical protein
MPTFCTLRHKVCLGSVRIDVAIMLLAGLFRLGAILFWDESFANHPEQDPDGYVAIARHWWTTGIYSRDGESPTALRPPGLVMFLVPLVADSRWQVVGLTAIHLFAGMGTSLLAMRLARSLGAEGGSWLAGVVVAIDPLLVGQSALIMSETVFTFFLTAGLVGSISKSSGARITFWTGLCWGLAGLTRPIAWPVLGWMTLAGVLGQSRKRALGVMLLALVPASFWVIRNEIALGRPILTTTHGGYTLWLGQNPSYFDSVVRPGRIVWPADSFDAWVGENRQKTAGMSEIEQDAFYSQEAVKWMKSQPADAVSSARHHLARFWSLAPARGSVWVQRGVAGFYLVLYFLAVVGLMRGRSREAFVLVGVVMIFSAVHAFYWSDMRMRAPLSPILASLAAMCLTIAPRPSDRA